MMSFVRGLAVLLLLAGVSFSAEKKADTGGKADEGEVVYEENFNDFSDDEETGFTVDSVYGVDISIENKIAQGKKAMKVTARDGVDYSKKYNMMRVSKEISFTNDNAKLSFSYYVGPGVKGIEIGSKNNTVGDNYGAWAGNAMQGKWNKTTIRFKNFKPKDPKSPASPKPGDAFKHLHITGSIAPGSDLKDQWYIIDDIKLTVDSGK